MYEVQGTLTSPTPHPTPPQHSDIQKCAFYSYGFRGVSTIIHTFIKDKRRHTSFLQCGSWWLTALNCFQFGRFSVFQSNPAGENSVAPIWWCKIVLKISFSFIFRHFPTFSTFPDHVSEPNGGKNSRPTCAQIWWAYWRVPANQCPRTLRSTDENWGKQFTLLVHLWVTRILLGLMNQKNEQIQIHGFSFSEKIGVACLDRISLWPRVGRV